MKYNFIVVRVEYPSEGGYLMEPIRLPDWVYLTISNDGNSKQLTVHSRIHQNKEVKMFPVFSYKFSDYEVIKELSGEINSRFL
jgi:hypothetical protein